jgi:hypothetical protein
MGDSQYNFSLATFSPSRKLVQIEHALTVVGFARDQRCKKIQSLTPNIGVVYRLKGVVLFCGDWRWPLEHSWQRSYTSMASHGMTVGAQGIM